MAHSGGSNALSQRKPWPYDAVLGSLGVLLKPHEDGQLVARRTATVSPQILDPGYGMVDPRLEIAYPYRNPVLGMGQRLQPPGTKLTRRYYWDYDCDSSIDGKTILGPGFTAQTVKAGYPVTDWFFGRYQGTDTVWALCGRYLMVLNAGVWTQVGDLGNDDYKFNQAIRWAPPSYTGDQRYRIWFTWQTGTVGDTTRIAYYDDTADFVVASAGANAGPPSPRWITSNRDELWVTDDFHAYRLLPLGDPLVSASWTKFYLEDESYQTTYANTNGDVPYFYKENDIYTIDEDGQAHGLFRSLRHSPSVLNGRNTITWMNSQYVPMADGFGKLSASAAWQEIGAELIMGAEAMPQGRVVGGQGHNTWFFYYVKHDPKGGDSFLIKYGAWIESEGDNNPQLMEKVDVHHGALKVWESKEATSCRILPVDGGNDRLYVGFSDGTCDFTNLPRNNPDPTADPNCTFATEGWHYMPGNTGGYAADTKLYRGFAVYGPRLSVDNHVKIDYRLDASTVWHDLEDADGNEALFTTPGQRQDFPELSQITGKVIFTRAHLVGDSISTTPIVEGVVIYQQVRPPFLLDFEFTVQALAGMKKRNGTIELRTPNHIRDRIQAMVSSGQTWLCIMPNGRTEELSFSDYAEALYGTEHSYGPGWEIVFKGTQFKPLSTQGGISERIWTYEELESYTLGQLEALL